MVSPFFSGTYEAKYFFPLITISLVVYSSPFIMVSYTSSDISVPIIRLPSSPIRVVALLVLSYIRVTSWEEPSTKPSILSVLEVIL